MLLARPRQARLALVPGCRTSATWVNCSVLALVVAKDGLADGVAANVAAQDRGVSVTLHMHRLKCQRCAEAEV